MTDQVKTPKPGEPEPDEPTSRGQLDDPQRARVPLSLVRRVRRHAQQRRLGGEHAEQRVLRREEAREPERGAEAGETVAFDGEQRQRPAGGNRTGKWDSRRQGGRVLV